MVIASGGSCSDTAAIAVTVRPETEILPGVWAPSGNEAGDACKGFCNSHRVSWLYTCAEGTHRTEGRIIGASYTKRAQDEAEALSGAVTIDCDLKVEISPCTPSCARPGE